MAYVQCKLCGRPISLSAQGGFGTCPHCGSAVTLPMRGDQERLDQLDRINTLRRSGDYDAALAACREPAETDPDDPELLWYRALCRFGVRYLEDQRTMEFLPVCSRGTGRFSDDPDVQAALQLSTGIVQRTYRREALRIDEAQPQAAVFAQRAAGGAGGPGMAEASVTACIKRGNLCLESGDFASARQFYDQALNLDAENGLAYLGLVMADQGCGSLRDLETALTSRFSREQVRRRSAGQPDMGRIKELCEKYAVEGLLTPAQITGELNYDLSFDSRWDSARANRQQTLEFFSKDRNYSLARRFANPALLQRLQALEQNVLSARDGRIAAAEGEDALHCREVMELYRKHLEEAEQRLALRSQALRRQLADDYQAALALQEEASTEEAFGQAAQAFHRLGNYEDAQQRREDCLEQLRELQKQRLEQEAKQAEAARLAREKKAAQQREKRKAASRKTIRGLIITAEILLLLAAGGFCVYHFVLVPAANYHRAEQLQSRGDYAQAISLYRRLGSYKDSPQKLEECRVGLAHQPADKAVELHREGKSEEALAALENMEQTDYVLSCIQTVKTEYLERLMEEGRYTAAVQLAHTFQSPEEVSRLKDDIQQRLVSRRREYGLDASIFAGGNRSLGLTESGSVLFAGYEDNYDRSIVSRWTDVVDLAVGNTFILCLRKDGSLLSCGMQGSSLADWYDLVDIAAFGGYALGVRADGTVLITGSHEESLLGVQEWTDIVAVSGGTYHVVGLRSDGTVVGVGSNRSGQLNFEDYTDVVGVAAGKEHTVLLMADGTVAAVGYNAQGQCNVQGLKNIVQIAACGNTTYALSANGRVTVLGDTGYGVKEAEAWTDIRQISAGLTHLVAVDKNGKAFAAGYNRLGQCDVGNWRRLRVPE